MWYAQDPQNVAGEERAFNYYQDIPEFASYMYAPTYFGMRGWNISPKNPSWNKLAYRTKDELCINLSDQDAEFDFSLGGMLEDYTIEFDYAFTFKFSYIAVLFYPNYQYIS